MGKLPYFPFYPGDWLSDPCLRRCSFEGRGFWVELLSLMWTSVERGVLCGTISELSRMCGLSQSEFERIISELEATNTADVTRSNGKITVVSRRMVRDEKGRDNNAYRQAKYRRKNKSNGRITDVAQMNNKDISFSALNSNNNQELVRSRFDKFWKLYPKKCGKKDAFNAFKSLDVNDDLLGVILDDIESKKKSVQWFGSMKEDNGQFIPLPANYLRNERWADEGVEKLSKRGISWDN